MLTPEPWAVAIFFALGVATAMLGSLVPALEAARAPPALALKAGDEERAFARAAIRSLPGFATLALGGVRYAPAARRGLPLFGYAAIALLLIGTLMLMPRFAARALSRAAAAAHAGSALALAQLRRHAGTRSP